MKIFTKDRTAIKLSTNSFAGGGEGDIYTHNNTAIKIFHKNSISESKIAELRGIGDNSIVAPQEPVFDKDMSCCGYAMPFLDSATPLSKIITTGFQNSNGITLTDVIKMLNRLRESFSSLHKANCLIVDGNEMNYLVNLKEMKIYLIDTDSFQTPSHKATAISPTTLDPISNGSFTEGSDWYIYAIISTLLLVGMHPFKGTHPKYIKREMTRRMLNGASIFDQGVKLPPIARSLDNIPREFREWLENTLANKIRTAPPALSKANAGKVSNEIHTAIIGGAKLTLYQDRVVWMDIDRRVSLGEKFIIEVDTIPMMFKIIDDKILFYNIYTGVGGDTDLTGQKIITKDNNIFIVNGSQIGKLSILPIGDNYLFGLELIIETMPFATTTFNNTVVQNILGQTMIGLILDGYLSFYRSPIINIVNAKHIGNLLIIVNSINGTYTKYTMDEKLTKEISIEVVDSLDI